MTKKTSKAATPKKTQPARSKTPNGTGVSVGTRRTFILFGQDEEKKLRAARFIDQELGLLIRAADAMDLIMCEVKTPKLSAVAGKLPIGRLAAGGTSFVPYIREELYDQLVKAAGDDAAKPGELPAALGVPQSFEEIRPGHLVIAQESLEIGWWEAIVVECNGDLLTLRYRDYPRFPKLVRDRNGIALPCTSPSS